MLRKVTHNNHRKLLIEQVSSRTISVYYNLHLMAIERGPDGVIYDFNPNKVCRFMKSRGIRDITYRQVLFSINELIDAGLLTYGTNFNDFTQLDKSILILILACETLEDYYLRTNDNEKLKELAGSKKIKNLVPHMHLSVLHTGNEFYKASIRVKRMFILVITRYNEGIDVDSKKSIEFNIRNKNTLTYIKDFIHLNNETKIIDTLNELQPFINSYQLTKNRFHRRNRERLIFVVKWSNKLVHSYEAPLVTMQQRLTFDRDLIAAMKRAISKCGGKQYSTPELLAMAKTMMFVARKNAMKIIYNFCHFSSVIEKSPIKYFEEMIHSYFLELRNPATN